ncbi:MAG: PLP-dependent aminotransferase family protein, partial [Ktedonobacterales bacterium]
DDEGLDPAYFEAACAAFAPRFLYLMPTYQNPTGASYSWGRCEAIMRIAHAHNVLLVEDDVYGLLTYEDTPSLPLKAADVEGRVLYITSFSKAFMPGLRLGAIVTNEPYLTALTQARQITDLNSSPFMQRALARYLEQGLLGTHLQAARDLYRQRRDALLDALTQLPSECRWTHPLGGLSLWLTLPPAVNEAQLVHDAIQEGIGVTRGQRFFSQPQQQGYVRLCFGAQPPARLREGIQRLGRTIARHIRQRDALAAKVGRESFPLV